MKKVCASYFLMVICYL